MPGVGVLFWTCLIFLILFLLLKKWAFPVINGMIRKREEKISSALEEAEIQAANRGQQPTESKRRIRSHHAVGPCGYRT